ncbi:MAG: DUF3048 domain-containing protein [Acidimicrobiia bacterium]|jgi:hypothetical protein
MSNFIAWFREHLWETVSAVLGVAVLVLAVFLFTGSDSGPGDEEATGTTTTTDSSGTTSSPASTAPAGEDDGSGSTTTLPEVPEGVTAVVVDNFPGVGYQIGLNAADLIIETPVEGGLSRFTALYSEELPPLIGPVRSLRPVSADLLAPFDPVVFTTGGQQFVLGSVAATGASIITPEDSIAFQSLERPQPHHIFVSPETEAHLGAALAVPWEVGEWQGGDPATEITLSLAGGITWRFEDGVYVRYQDGEPQEVLADVDGESEPLTRETIIVLVANQKSAGYTDSAGADVPTFDVVGGGDLYMLHGGEYVSGTWARLSQADGYTFLDEAGDSVRTPAGGVYLVVEPLDGEIAITQ